MTYVLLASDIFSSESEPIAVALVVAMAATANLVIASVAGAGIPVLLRRMGLDPALASAIFVTLLTDIVGFGGFLLIAAWLL